MLPIADLHCDLLEYLAQGPHRSPNDPSIPCNLPAMKQGNVLLQVLAVFTKTEPGSVKKGQRQVDAYEQLLVAKLGSSPWHPTQELQVQWAIENASAFFEENESLAAGFRRLHSGIERFGRPLYLSLTWNDANRFGGGNASKRGLTQDGKDLLEVLAAEGIALDLSHTSDALAVEAINEIERKGLKLRILASHSNSRTVRAVERNLPDELVREIVRRRGLIGLNFFQVFVGNTWTGLCAHVEKLLDLGAESSLCFGADFFHCSSVPVERLLAYPGGQPFFPELSSSAAYPRVLDLLSRELGVDDSFLEDLAYRNVERFLA